ncbi:hypothetical protein BRC65_06305 [Halobacteriales archaeon QH_2_65_14]|jgi:hypothetical protein|nr:MAG: hypothetical protein BRC65_06305 [Halobacteriales archaeon QH_2_65_14]
MLDRFGIVGLLGVVLLIGGIGAATWQNPVIGGALALVVAGLGLIVYGLISNLLQAFGMGEMM